MKLRRLIQIEDRRQAAYERRFAGKIFKALKQQAEDFIETGDIKPRMNVVFDELYDTVMRDYLSRQWEQLDRNIEKRRRFFIDSWERWLVQFKMEQLTMKVVGIDETTRDMLRKEVLRGAEAGEEMIEIGKRIREVMGGKAGKARARMIARTEVGQAVNYAKTKSSDDWQAETGMQLGKLWIHRGAKDPRDWHMALDNGRPIPKDKPFVVSVPETGITDLMMYPHDPSASAENVINCGCQVIYIRME